MTDQTRHATSVLSVSNVRVDFGERTVLDNVTFDVNAGEFTGLIGANGTGKTTLLRVILGLLEPSAGQVRLARNERSRHALGYVPQKIHLDPDMPVRARDFVALGIDGERFGIAKRSKLRAQAIDEMLAAVEAEHFADRRVGTLSGGEQQRVLIAHALISRPALVLLDEPLANLDPGSAQEIVDLLHSLTRTQNIAVLLSAHEMNSLLPVMDRLVYVANSHVASGTIDEVVQPGVLSALYGHHVDVVRVHGRLLVITGSPTPQGASAAEHPALVVE